MTNPYDDLDGIFIPTYGGTDILSGHGDTVRVGNVINVYWHDSNSDGTVELENSKIVAIRDNVLMCKGGTDNNGNLVSSVCTFSAGRLNGPWWRTFKVADDHG